MGQSPGDILFLYGRVGEAGRGGGTGRGVSGRRRMLVVIIFISTVNRILAMPPKKKLTHKQKEAARAKAARTPAARDDRQTTRIDPQALLEGLLTNTVNCTSTVDRKMVGGLSHKSVRVVCPQTHINHTIDTS